MKPVLESQSDRLRLLEMALAGSDDGVLIADAQGRTVFANDAVARLAYLTRPESTPVSAEPQVEIRLARLDGRSIPPEEAPLARALRGEIVSGYPAVAVVPDGSHPSLSITANPARDDEGRVFGAVCVFHQVNREVRTDVEWQRLTTALQECRAKGRGEAEVALLSQMVYERERWRTMVESMLDPVTVCDAEGSVTYINPAYEHLIGGHVGDGLSLAEHPVFYQLYHSDGTLFAPADLPLQRAALYGEDVHDVEIVHRASDGHEFIGVFSASPLRDGDGRIMGAVAVGRDVTALRRAETVIRAGEVRYRALFDSLSEGLGVHEMLFAADGEPRDYRFLDVNAAFEIITGLRREEVLGRTVREVLPGIEQSWIDRYGEVVRTGVPMRFESYSAPLRKHFEVVAYCSSPGQFATLFIDVTERKRTEVEREELLAQVEAQRERAEEKATEALRANAQLNALLENLGEAVVIADAKGRVILRNQVARDITGVSNDRTQAVLEGREQAEILYPDGRPMPDTEQGLLKILRGEEVAGQEVIFVRPDGVRRWLLSSGSTVRNERGEIQLAIMVYNDITTIRQLENAREEFIALAAHELKTPLTTIKGFVHLLNRQGGHDEREHEAFRTLRTQTERMVRIVQGMINTIQVQSGSLQLRRESLEPRRAGARRCAERRTGDYPALPQSGFGGRGLGRG